jgi:hypothetical protein
MSIADCGLMKGARRKVQGTRRFGSFGFAVIGSLRCAAIGHRAKRDGRSSETDETRLEDRFRIAERIRQLVDSSNGQMVGIVEVVEVADLAHSGRSPE